jgi:RNA polymerase sigma factor (sigma-70 family)
MAQLPTTTSDTSKGILEHRNAPDLEEIFRALAPSVLGYLRAAGAQDAENMAGDVFLAVAKGLRRFNGAETDLRGWVFTIAHHKLIDERRRMARRKIVRRAARPSDSYEDAPFDPGVTAALRTLTPEQLEIVTLRFVADLPLGTVAKITERSVEAVKAMQHRALESLARVLNAHHL